jgi:hypothetical protein
MKHLADWIVAPGNGFRILLPTAHQSTLLRRKFRLISCRSMKIGEEERSILKVWTLKVPKCEIFDPFFITPINPIWIGDLRTG